MARELEPTRRVAPRMRAGAGFLAVLAIAAASWLATPVDAVRSQVSPGAPPVSEAQSPGSSTSTPTGPGSDPGGTPDSGTAPELVPGDTTTTTVVVPPSLPPEYEGNPLAGYLVDPGEADGLDEGTVQRGFDLASVTVRPDLVAAAEAQLRDAERGLTSVRALLSTRRGELSAAETQLAELDGAVRTSISRAALARQKLADHAVRAFVVGDVDQRLALVKIDDVTDVGIARRYAGALGTSTERLVREYRAETVRLSDEQLALAGQLALLRTAVTDAEAAEAPAIEAVFDAQAQLTAYEAGAHAYVKGFVFPIAGRSDFIDSWGFPRSGGRWHQGADVFAAYGTPLIASENGVLEKVGTAGLGGLRLWLVGESGNEYYYAHLAGFAPGMTDGRRVRVGEVVGFVGDSGNARGTPPHLHFEIHPGGAGPVNPYPLLRAAYDARPQLGPSRPGADSATILGSAGG